MSKLERVAIEVGEAVANRAGLPRLGMEMLEAAAKGRIGTDDVNNLYAAYYEAANPNVKVNEELLRSAPFKANASKLRQLLKLGTEHRSASIDVMNRALQMR
jgi:hypothetical protein